MISHHRWTAMIAVIVLSVPGGAEPPATQVDARVEAVAAMAAQTPDQAASPQTPNTQAPNPQPPAEPSQASLNEVSITVGKSMIISTAQPIERISVGYNDVAEATAVSPREVLVNGKAVGETSLIVWERDGNKLFFDLRVRPNNFVNETRAELVRQQLKKELAGSSVNLSFENDTAFLRGTVKDLTSADRAVAIASTLGKTVNLLYVNVPASDAQILLKVRFASVDRSVSSELGLNLVSTGATNTIGRVTTGQFSPPGVSATGTGNNGPGRGGTSSTVTLSDALNIFLLRPDLNLAATIRAFESRGLVEILAEPNVLAINGRQANFLAGGEFPYPILQGGGAGLGTVTIAFREFGVRINFIPTLTPRGTLRLEVAPEVSALDFANGLVFQGFNIPALTVRRVHTSIELNAGQSFAIGGLLDNRLTETLEKLPLLGDIPILGKIFRSRALRRDNTELVVLITPELVRPIPSGQPTPELNFPKEFLKPNTNRPIRSPGTDITGMVPVTPPQEAVPVEQLIQSLRQPKLEAGTSAAGLPDTNYQAPDQLPPFPAPPASAPTQAAPTPSPTVPPK